MMRPQLTIAIPTYNRQEKLKECLERVINYSKNMNIEILVSDNASSDDTQTVVNDIQKFNPQIRYYRNKENLGFDGNFLNCFEKAKGEYVWLMSDDDILLPGAVESVLEGCTRKPICMHLNSSGIESENPLTLGKARFVEKGLIEFTDRNFFIKSIGIYCTFVSSLVFNSDLVKAIKNKEQYFGTNILQSHILFETMKNDGVYIINSYNCLAARGNNTVRYDVLETWIKNFSELLLTTGSNCKFDKKVLSEILKKELSSTVYEFVLHFRQTCENEFTWNRDCIWPYIEKYPDIVNKYQLALKSSKKKLKLLQYKYKISRKMKSLWIKIKLIIRIS